MKPEPGELRLLVDDTKTMIRGMGKDMAKRLGSIKEPMDTKEQMLAFEAMTPQDWARMLEEQGPEKTAIFRKAMLQRKEASYARKPIS